jgi:hypothetical protein
VRGNDGRKERKTSDIFFEVDGGSDGEFMDGGHIDVLAKEMVNVKHGEHNKEKR